MLLRLSSVVLIVDSRVLNRENSLVWHKEIFAWINHYSGVSK